MQKLQFIQTTPQQLSELINEGVKNQLAQLKKELQHQENIDELLTRQEACKFLQINSSTLWHWTNKGKIKAYGIANRRYYKRSELLEALKPLKKQMK
ncbi:helix-turn-helix domain-containing protein [Aureibaculum sp. A20]|uniref:Helix-turn-helix domain-containing protein n=1 Tax=Aureibaculum flavum TaxID=2795986 RepID=A0ABS0WQC6_9FLAO|nr:helix-turn-helix domain-containing protein [Aureibaculum flavum]MBJ2174179.1 helix-turn-helix domain-containing protein [Aureibaculum flavum]